ncbi:3,4-dihydroxyphenylacetate 2,3-dioxygenase [Ktedonosporobacter rubrisoli]|uniref:3,4-dihydroxyphenylacetate 2,3-dioxygenase n=1 Tax=Ktedonosporobacter rubrisoli TaxID=2509675 RepID=A0A4V0YYX7_KTERU|nr:3,4-dihydroxyphenylacetate 2,3-dioxygenase [Ktedonosporobacter rubrisoli]QBD77761.1 3,4-dihydroxyphenylacetate 2,3-dioxygenase [Ktedonosporobacter rubrisoli]
MTLRSTLPQPEFNVLRAAHAEFYVRDLGRAREFYVDLLGFVETEHDDEHLYLRCLEEREHHSLVLRKGAQSGASHIAFRVASPDDLERLALLAKQQKLPQRWITGAERGQDCALRLQDPSGLPLEFYAEMTQVPRMLQAYHLHKSVQVMRLDHFNCQVPDVATAATWYRDALGFRTTEYTVKETPLGEELWASWLTRKHTVHDLALMNGLGPRLHHVGFWLPDALAVLRACDVLAAAGYHDHIERGPGRHGLSNALFVYVRDPDGNRIELYANDYLTADLDAEPIRWTLEDPRRQTFWGNFAPTSWFEEALLVETVQGDGFVPPRAPLLRDRPDHVT